jgi:hypothetical protein
VEFFSEKNRASLLHCVVDGADEVCYFFTNSYFYGKEN